jgi:hypothetical protein
VLMVCYCNDAVTLNVPTAAPVMLVLLVGGLPASSAIRPTSTRLHVGTVGFAASVIVIILRCAHLPVLAALLAEEARRLVQRRPLLGSQYDRA